MITVRVRNANEISTSVLADSYGRVYLDLPEEFEVTMTKAMDRFNDVQSLSQEVALTVDVPATSANDLILSEYGGPLLYERDSRMLIEVQQDGERLPLTAAYVKRYEAGQYEIEMFGDDWQDELEELPFSGVDAGTFEYTNANVLAAWGDREALAVPMFAHYGGWRTAGNVTRQDLRFWFNLGKLLRAVFCSIGWEFDSPHLFDGDGRSMYAYLGGEDWYSYEDKRAFAYAKLEINAPFQSTGSGAMFGAWTAVDDPNNSWNNFRPDEYFYGASETIRIRHKLVLDITMPAPNPADVEAPRLNIVCVKNDNNATYNELFVETITGSPDQSVRRTIELEWTDESATSGDGYYLEIYYNNSQGFAPFTINSGTWTVSPDPPHLIEDDTIPLGDMIDPTITAGELLEAVAHLMNGKLVTDYAQRKVTMYAPYDYERTGDDAAVEGFYLRDDVLDVRAITVPKSIAWSNESVERNRYLLYKFADSDDARVDTLDTNTFQRRVDRGAGKADETDVKNPLFEPSGNVTTTAAETGGAGAAAIALWDNDEGRISQEIGPRVAIFYGRLDTGGSISFEGQIITDPTYLTMAPSSNVANLDARMFLTFNGSSLDLYNRFYKREAMQDDDGRNYSVLLLGGDATYDMIDFRRPLLIAGDNAPFLIQPVAVKDHERGSAVPILVTGKILTC